MAGEDLQATSVARRFHRLQAVEAVKAFRAAADTFKLS
jgi:hypothetical protein